ncbi:MAG: glycoside hydrolase family 25 protein [Pseudomonadota bacterium]
MQSHFTIKLLAICGALIGCVSNVAAGEFYYHWKDKSRALVLDGYEFNEFDLVKIAENKRIVGFIHKGSDGLAAAYRCRGDEYSRKLCREKWRRYSVGRELYHTRRALAKALGLKWGAYHLGRPGNPIEQAQHFLQYTRPTDDEIVVIDIEDNDPEKWMSLKDAERFARYIHNRLGRWPMLYTNGSTTKFIADNADEYPILSRLPLWYARFKPDIRGHFPKGNWDSYGIWQFGSHINCNKRSCLYRVDGANDDIDVNVVDMTVEELRAAWPLDELVPAKVKPDIYVAQLPKLKPLDPMRTAAIADHGEVLDQFDLQVLMPLATFRNEDDIFDWPAVDKADTPRSLSYFYVEYALARTDEEHPSKMYLAKAIQADLGAAPIAIPARYQAPAAHHP